MPNLPPEGSERLGAILEFWGKAAGALMAVFLLVEKIGKPYFKWRQERFALTIRGILAVEITAIAHVGAEAEAIHLLLERILSNQEAIFEDMDDFLLLVKDNRDRHDETAELLDLAGLGMADRRVGQDRRKEANTRMDAVMENMDRRARRRRHDLSDVSPIMQSQQD